MLTLTEVKEKTDQVFTATEEKELELPQPNHHWLRKLEALEEANLDSQRKACLFDMRCEQAQTLGFEQIKSSIMVEMIMGEKHTHTDDVGARQNHEFFYNHHTDETLVGADCNWGSKPTQFWHMCKKNPWFVPPFRSVEKWRCQFGCLDHLKREIPYGVVLRINEVKSLNLFNAFSVLAPMEAWERKTDIDPIVVASVWEVTAKSPNSKASSAGQSAHFFLAQW